MARLHSYVLAALTLLALQVTLASCERKPEQGFLTVKAPSTGTFDIFRLANESSLQFVSEQVGEFNEELALAPGSYVVLADCSSETVIIYPGAHETLNVHRIEFVAPHPPGPLDSFGVQCSRSDKTRSRQHISNRYELNLIHGKRDLLVGMVPMHIDFDALPDKGSTTLSYKLSALQVADYEGNNLDVSYFVSPVNELISVTKYQRFGHWEFLLPGQYVLEVNGTRMQVDLQEGEERVVKPALLRVSTSEAVDLEQPVRVKGSPWLVEINSGHWLNFNETYPVLPGKAEVKISGSSHSVEVALEEGVTTDLQTRSVLVDMGCEPHDVACLGDKDISLYIAEEPYPFVESLSDMPIIFIDEGKPVLVSVAGSRDITYELPLNVRDKTLHVGYIKIIPQPQHRPGQVTDLVRVDSVNAPIAGHTLDVNLEKPTLMPLVAGFYHLTHYLSATAAEGVRSNQTRGFTIEPGKTIDVELPVFFSEKKYNAYKKRSEPEKPATDDDKPGEIGHSEKTAPERAL